MNKEEIDEIDKLEIDFNNIDELNLALEISSKKAIYLLDEFSEIIINLKQENKQLKEVIETLKETNKLLLQQKGQLQENLDMLDKRIDKSIEYINHAQNYGKEKNLYINGDDLLEILKGDGNNDNN